MSVKIEQYITKKADGTYSVRVSGRLGTKMFTRRKKGFSTLGEARHVRGEFMVELSLARKRLAEGMLWKDALEEYLHKEPRIQKPKTYSDVSTALRAHTAAWLNKTIQEITDQDVCKILQGSLEGAEDATRNKVVGYISRVFKFYIKRSRVKINPTLGVLDIGKRKPDKKLIAMTREEMMTLLVKAKEVEHPWFFAWFIDYQTGMRSGELYALEWRQVDFEGRRITIDQAFDGVTTEAPTKTGEIRVVSMGEGLMRVLKELKLNRASERYVLPRNKEWEHGKAASGSVIKIV